MSAPYGIWEVRKNSFVILKAVHRTRYLWGSSVSIGTTILAG
jgi:hypothetical protein